MKPQEILSKLEDKGVKTVNGSNGHDTKDVNGSHARKVQLAEVLLKELNDEHFFTGNIDTPMRKGAFDMADAEKILLISEKVRDILDILGLDLTDDSLKDTPLRVAKMYVKEVFSGLNPANKPQIQLFENKYGYKRMLVERDISLHSYCEHHLVPIIGKVHVGYISSGKVIGLSKINRIVRYFAKRPQVQERLTEQIAQELKNILQTQDVAVVVEAEHFCVITRGVEDTQSSTVTSHYSGAFEQTDTRREFLDYMTK